MLREEDIENKKRTVNLSKLQEKYAKTNSVHSKQRDPLKSIECGINSKQKNQMITGQMKSKQNVKNLKKEDQTEPSKKVGLKKNIKLEKTRPSINNGSAN